MKFIILKKFLHYLISTGELTTVKMFILNVNIVSNIVTYWKCLTKARNLFCICNFSVCNFTCKGIVLWVPIFVRN